MAGVDGKCGKCGLCGLAVDIKIMSLSMEKTNNIFAMLRGCVQGKLGFGINKLCK
ncbi:MAG: hypothetical protein IJ661_05095 [Lachnospiraceae bacterium]|nr:hypothetical protein [Lachnospiraceae bacterium]